MTHDYEEIDEGVKAYFDSLKHYKSLNKKEEHELLEAYKKHNDLSARNKLIEANLKYACKLANDYRGNGVPFNDLISEANDGLIRAIDDFDMNYDVKLFSYSKWKIIQSLQKAIAEKGKLNVDKYNDYILDANSDDKMHGDELISDTTVKNNFDISDFLKKALSVLSQRERDIILYYTGIDGYAKIVERINPDTGEVEKVKVPYNLEEIGEMYGLTKERVRQIKEKAMTKVRSEAMLLDNVYID